MHQLAKKESTFSVFGMNVLQRNRLDLRRTQTYHVGRKTFYRQFKIWSGHFSNEIINKY